MKVKCTRCDICGKDLVSEEKWIFKYRRGFLKSTKWIELQDGKLIKRKYKYDFCDDCWSKLRYGIETNAQEWLPFDEYEPRWNKSVFVTDGEHYGIGVYYRDENDWCKKWKVASLDKIEKVTHWKYLDAFKNGIKEKPKAKEDKKE